MKCEEAISGFVSGGRAVICSTAAGGAPGFINIPSAPFFSFPRLLCGPTHLSSASSQHGEQRSHREKSTAEKKGKVSSLLAVTEALHATLIAWKMYRLKESVWNREDIKQQASSSNTSHHQRYHADEIFIRPLFFLILYHPEGWQGTVVAASGWGSKQLMQITNGRVDIPSSSYIIHHPSVLYWINISWLGF